MANEEVYCRSDGYALLLTRPLTEPCRKQLDLILIGPSQLLTQYFLLGNGTSSWMLSRAEALCRNLLSF